VITGTGVVLPIVEVPFVVDVKKTQRKRTARTNVHIFSQRKPPESTIGVEPLSVKTKSVRIWQVMDLFDVLLPGVVLSVPIIRNWFFNSLPIVKSDVRNIIQISAHDVKQILFVHLVVANSGIIHPLRIRVPFASFAVLYVVRHSIWYALKIISLNGLKQRFPFLVRHVADSSVKLNVLVIQMAYASFVLPVKLSYLNFSPRESFLELKMSFRSFSLIWIQNKPFLLYLDIFDHDLENRDVQFWMRVKEIFIQGFFQLTTITSECFFVDERGRVFVQKSVLSWFQAIGNQHFRDSFLL
jgi:hypothetical protein